MVRTVRVVDTSSPVITLIGDANHTHEAGGEYLDEGAVWTDLVDGNGTADANGTVNENVPGTYLITYTFTDSSGNNATPVVRTVRVVDTSSPVITLIGEANHTHEAGSEYVDERAVWTDLVDGNGTADANGTVNEDVPGTYLITYTFTDTSGNHATPMVRTVRVVDTTAPVITLIGDANLTHEAGGKYVDRAVWTDLVDGNGTADANGTVNENVPGTYLITYTFTDSSGNHATPVVRTVVVINKAPHDLNTTEELSVPENQPVGFAVGQFTAKDLEGDDLIFSFSEGTGDTNNIDFVLSPKGELTTAKVFDFEEGQSKSIRVEANDSHGGVVQGQFLVSIIDDPNDDLTLEQTNFVTNGSIAEVGVLRVWEEVTSLLAWVRMLLAECTYLHLIKMDH